MDVYTDKHPKAVVCLQKDEELLFDNRRYGSMVLSGEESVSGGSERRYGGMGFFSEDALLFLNY